MCAKDPKDLYFACNSTAPNSLQDQPGAVCKCPCDIAKVAADIKAATEEYIITKVMSSLNTL